VHSEVFTGGSATQVSSEVRGTVKWYIEAKGFGFIVADNGAEFFVRQENIEVDGYKGLRKRARVIFEVGKDEDGKLEATRVRPEPGSSESMDDTAR